MGTRAKEMGLRKVFGTSKLKIMSQFIIETCVAVTTAGVVSLLVLFIISMLGFLPMSWTTILIIVIVTIIICVLFGLISGFYLGAILSGYSISSLLQNKLGLRTSKFST